ncbi:hypothetical protein [Pararhizobium sp. PWRC1-1]|uniref:hypothetical protein n=1 Tax=Pararhizobium sp. PWRC1-1 TaxID=2804566 RepID=UPI003CF5B9CE
MEWRQSTHHISTSASMLSNFSSFSPFPPFATISRLLGAMIPLLSQFLPHHPIQIAINGHQSSEVDGKVRSGGAA